MSDLVQKFAMSKYMSSSDRNRAIFEHMEAQEKEIARLSEQVKSSAIQAVGWTHAYCCAALDDGVNLREVECPEILEKAVKQLGLEA